MAISGACVEVCWCVGEKKKGKRENQRRVINAQTRQQPKQAPTRAPPPPITTYPPKKEKKTTESKCECVEKNGDSRLMMILLVLNASFLGC